MEDRSEIPAAKPELHQEDLSALTETQRLTHGIRSGAIERFGNDSDALRQVINFSDELDSMVLIKIRGGGGLERFRHDISESPDVQVYILSKLKKGSGQVLEVPKETINPDLSSIKYSESVISGVWLEERQPKDPEKYSGHSLVGSELLLTTE